VIQEALNNAFRHAGGVEQQVYAKPAGDSLLIEIADSGPGFDFRQSAAGGERLGLSGMRERVESLGGTFNIESERGRGTRSIARLPYHVEGLNNG